MSSARWIGANWENTFSNVVRPAVKHLHLTFPAGFQLPASPDHHHIPKPIVLASLSVQNFTTLTLNRRLLLLMQPFTVSNLKALSIMAGSVEWPDVAPAMDTLEILEIHSESDHTNFDLNAFPKIHLLRIRVAPAATTNFIAADRYMGLLFSIARALHLRTVIQLHCGEPQLSAICATFDQALATLRGLAVEIVFSLTQKAPLAALFPKLSAKKCFVVHRSIGIGGTKPCHVCDCARAVYSVDDFFSLSNFQSTLRDAFYSRSLSSNFRSIGTVHRLDRIFNPQRPVCSLTHVSYLSLPRVEIILPLNPHTMNCAGYDYCESKDSVFANWLVSQPAA